MGSTKPDNTRNWQICCSILVAANIFLLWVITREHRANSPHRCVQLLQEPLTNSSTTAKTFTDLHDCGSSRHEALAKGCIFDIMAAAWVPKQCYDEEEAQTALSSNTSLAKLGGSGSWPWFQDKEFTVEVAETDLWSVEVGQSWTWETYHVAHCLYEWRVLSRAWDDVHLGKTGVYIHDKAADTEHVQHCNLVIANQNMRHGAKSLVTFGFRSCVRLDRR